MFEIESNVLTPDAPHPTSPAHRANGKFAPGNKLGGRAKRAEEAALLAALDETLPAEKFKDHMKLCEEWAIEYKSPKLLMQIWAFRFAYTIGTPIQRSMTASTKLESIMNRLGEMDDGEFSRVEEAIRDS